MAKRSRTVLKGFFEAGDVPSQDNYSDLIDSFYSLDGQNSGSLNITGSLNVDPQTSSSFGDIVARNITASGDISASGIVYADTFKSAVGDENPIISFNDLKPKLAKISLTSSAIKVNKLTTFSGVPVNFSLSFSS